MLQVLQETCSLSGCNTDVPAFTKNMHAEHILNVVLAFAIDVHQWAHVDGASERFM